MTALSLYDKLWNSHVVHTQDDGTSLIYIDRHLVHEVTSPQAFESLRLAGREPWRKASILAVPDHNVPTKDRHKDIADPVSRKQLQALDENCNFFALQKFEMNDPRQGIVHVIGPEQGASLPGMTIVCGDSHTSTHGALAALAFGIGTSEVEHVLATQCLLLRKTKSMRVNVNGVLAKGVYSKDIVLALIAKIGTAGGNGHTMEFCGDAIERLSIEARMTICNMSIEAGARAGVIGVDDKTIDYICGRPFAPKDAMWDEAVKSWRKLISDEGAHFDSDVDLDASQLSPQVSWGTSPEMVVPVDGVVPDPDQESNVTKAEGMRNALAYMGLAPGQVVSQIKIDKVFIGSCTNSRIEDLREAAQVVQGKTLASNIKLGMIVPGSGLVKRQAEQEGLDQIFKSAGFEWRDPGCSMCLGMNADQLESGERCASTSNRNFEGRQGQGGRTHLVSPAMAAAAGIAGHFDDARKYFN
ncbi:MAG: 3-isopropylmalate dehydratase large subunit [Gammaproteobacteria bacterium]|nr:3-isopropylmalate dehydratase large subunit [Gammaproteobacteria bacterium]